MRDEYIECQRKVRSYIETPFNETERENFQRDYNDIIASFQRYKNECIAVVQHFVQIFAIVMPQTLNRLSGAAIKDMLLRWFNLPGGQLENFYNELNEKAPAPHEIDSTSNTNRIMNDFSHTTEFNHGAKIKAEYRNKTIVFALGLIIFFADILFMAMQYGDSLNDPLVGWLLSVVIVVIIIVLSIMSGSYFFKPHRAATSALLLVSAVLVDIIAILLRVFMVYSPDSPSAGEDGNLYFPNTIIEKPDSLLMALIIGGLTLFGIILTWSHAKVILNTDYKVYRHLFVQFAAFTKVIPEFRNYITRFENYATENGIEFEKIDM